MKGGGGGRGEGRLITGLKKVGSIYVSGKPPTCPFPRSTLTLTSHLGQNVGIGEG